ncbi:3-hydroxyanthranilate 3,4-dioxygenase [bacterium]|nr:3-hydroxyanthranilate 3,4-dioxygenase [bacterium]
MKLPDIITLQTWIEANRHLLKPPVGNKVIYDDDFIVMVVGGPNRRNDFHFDEGAELFYQLEGEMRLDIMRAGQREEIPLRAGEMFLLPPRVPHSPQRMAGSIGLVVERQRRPHELDGLMWFCPACQQLLYEEYFHLENIETQFPPVFERFNASDRNCPQCGNVHPPA